MSKVKTDAIETRAGGTSVLTIGTATQTIKLPGGTPGADKVLTSNATGEATWAAAGGGLFSAYAIPSATKKQQERQVELLHRMLGKQEH